MSLIVTWRLLSAVKVGKADQPLTSSVKQVARERPFMILVALLMGYWFMYLLSVCVNRRSPCLR